MSRFLAQIGKAARLMDLKGDVEGAVTILESVLDDPEIDQYPAEKVEVIVFIADLHIHIKENKKAAKYLNRLTTLNLHPVEPDLIDPHLKRAQELRSILSHSGD